MRNLQDNVNDVTVMHKKQRNPLANVTRATEQTNSSDLYFSDEDTEIMIQKGFLNAKPKDKNSFVEGTLCFIFIIVAFSFEEKKTKGREKPYRRRDLSRLNSNNRNYWLCSLEISLKFLSLRRLTSQSENCY